jgi:hypothetical protein
MPDDSITDLVRHLIRVRGLVAADMLGSPAWAATVEWCDELEAEIRSIGIDPDALDPSPEPTPRPRRPARSHPRRIDHYPASAR